jgi:hypothetical protein
LPCPARVCTVHNALDTVFTVQYKLLLWLEELQQEIDIRQYDIDETTLLALRSLLYELKV